MRKLMWFTVGFTVVCALWAYALDWYIWICVLAAAVLAGWRFRKNRGMAVLLAAMIGAGVGLGWCLLFAQTHLRGVEAFDGASVNASIVVCDYSAQTTYGGTAEGEMTCGGENFRVKLYLNGTDGLCPGDRVSGTFRLQSTAAGGEGALGTYRGQGIFLLAYPIGSVRVERPEQIPWKYFPAVLRYKLLSQIREAFPEDVGGFAEALLLSDRSDLGYETATAFTVSGISHIIAVSGLHVSILMGLLYILAGRRRFLSMAIGTPLLLLFAAVVGFTPSVTRACIMQIMLLAATALDREYDPPTALSSAALVILLRNPMTVTSVSFQMSVGCVAGIFLFYSPISEWLTTRKWMGGLKGKGLLPWLKRWCVASVSVSISANIVVIPLVAWYFGAVSLIGVLTNLLVLWVVSILFVGVLFAGTVSFLSMPLAKLLGWLLAWPMRYVVGTAKLLSKFPFAALYTRNTPTVIFLVGCYALLGLYLCVRRKPALFAGIAAAGLVVTIAFSWVTPMLEDFRMTVLDVGQGQCVVLQSEGKTFLVDCGGDRGENVADIAAETLLSQGVSRIDGIILTHFDEDHICGVEYLLTRLETDALLLPSYEEHMLLCDERAVPVTQPLEIAYGNTKITLIPARNATGSNEWSMCVLFQTEKCDILITGDRNSQGEQELMTQIALPDLEALVVGHHGSKNSTSKALLAATTPEVAIISVGKGNRYGHPAEEVLDRLESWGCTVLRTDIDGTIIYRG